MDSTRKEHWKHTCERVDRITDRLGKPVDDGIKNAVIAFLALDFPTTSSCAGHLPSARRFRAQAPWVEITYPIDRPWLAGLSEEDRSREHPKIINQILLEKKRCFDLLEVFYRDRPSLLDVQIILSSRGDLSFTIQSHGASFISVLSPTEQKDTLELYQNEMRDLASFLKDWYLTKKGS